MAVWCLGIVAGSLMFAGCHPGGSLEGSPCAPEERNLVECENREYYLTDFGINSTARSKVLMCTETNGEYAWRQQDVCPAGTFCEVQPDRLTYLCLPP